MARTTRAGILATLIAGCTVEQGGNDPFGTPTTYTTYATTQPGDDESDSSGSTGGDATSENTSSGASESTGDAAEMESTSDTGLGGSSEGSTGGALPGDGQPMDGMWSHCTTAQECGPIPALCIYMVDQNENPVDGFCTETGCANPAVDCAANPGGTAPPICVPMEIDGMADQVCALNCGAGTCPAGMVCMNFTDLGMVCM